MVFAIFQQSFDVASQLVYEGFPKQDPGRPLFDVWPRCQIYVQHAVNLTKLHTIFWQGRETFIGLEVFVKLLCNCGYKRGLVILVPPEK